MYADSQMCSILARSDYLPNTIKTIFKMINHEPTDRILSLLGDVADSHNPAARDILAALEELAASRKKGSNSLDRISHIAQAFIRFSLAFIQLYIPDQPFDPASEFIVGQKVLERRHNQASSKLESRTAIEKRLRTTTSKRWLVDSSNLDLATRSLDAASRIRIVRPPVSQISSIHEDFRYVVDPLVLHTILQDLTDTQRNKLRIANILDNFERIASRLSANYPMYNDMLILPSCVLSRFIFGVRLKSDIDAVVTSNSVTMPPFTHLLSMDRFTRPITIDIWRASQPKGNHRVELEHHLFALETIVISSRLSGLQITQVEMVGELLDECYRQWRMARERHKLEHAAKNDIYRRKDVENDLENAIAEFFPDHLLDLSITDAFSKDSNEEIALSLCNIHRKLFGPTEPSVSPTDIQQTILSGLKLSVAQPNFLDLDDVISISFPAQILALASCLSEQSTPVDAGQYDFYRSPRFEELETLINVVSNARERVAAYLDAWPENSILGDILNISERVGEFPAAVPLSHLLPVVERLYTSLDQWQGVASRDYTLSEFHQNVKDVIVRWRKLELGSWRSLMDAEERKHRDQVSSWWFDIYELVIYNLRNRSVDIPDYAVKVIAAVNDFVLSASIGDFESRLELILSFAIHAHHEARLHPGMETISRSCHHLHRLHSVHALTVSNALTEQKKSLEKEIAETVQLASWRDTSVYALTESAKRSHYRLYKTLRKFREQLSKPVGPILQAAGLLDLKSVATSLTLTFPHSTVGSSKSAQNDLVVASAKACELGKVWSSHGRMFWDPLKLSSAVAQVFGRVSARSPELPVVVQEFIDTIDSLSKQTPSTLTDENERQVKFLKTQKRRLFVQTMKQLREWGIASRSSDLSTSYTVRLQSTPVIPWGLASVYSTIDQLFYRILDLLPKVRSASIDHSPDLLDAESQRALGYVDSLIHELFASRQVIFELSDSVHALKNRLQSTLSMFATHAGVDRDFGYVSPSAPSPVDTRRTLLRRTDIVVETSISLVRAHQSLASEIEVGLVISFLQEIRSDCQRQLADGTELPFNEDVVYQAGVIWCNDVDKWFFDCSQSLLAFSGRYRGFHYIFDPIVRCLQEIREVDCMSGSSSRSEFDIQSFRSAAEGLGASCLVASQELSKTVDTVAMIGSTRLPQEKTFSKNITKIIQSRAIIERINTTHQHTISALQFHDELPTVSAAINCLLPVLETFAAGCADVLNRMLEDHEQFSRMTLALMTAFHTLATKGYCSPQRADKEKGGEVADGIGLGEGEGETDITNELKGDQEGLDELGQAEKGEGKDEKGDEDGEGIDMDDDFEGDMEDRRDQEQKEQEDDGGSEDMDEGTGAVDDFDPSAVDEQFWEEQTHQPDAAKDEKQTDAKIQSKEQPGELGAGDQDEKSKENPETSAEDQTELSQGEDAEESSDEGVQNREDDALMPEAEPLDLPEDLDLNRPNGENKAEEIDEEMDIDEMQEEGEQAEDADKIGENEAEDETGHVEEKKLDEQQDEPDVADTGTESRMADPWEYQDHPVPTQAPGKGGENIGQDSAEAAQESPETAGDQNVAEPPLSAIQAGASRSKDPTKEIQTASRNESQNDHSEKTESTPNPFRKLGDMIEQWRRDVRNVQDVDSDEADREQTVGDKNLEFSYVGEEEQLNDQALGPAAPEQVQPLDMSMAIDEEMFPHESQSPHNNDRRDDPQADRTDVDGPSHPTFLGASIGEPIRAIAAPEPDAGPADDGSKVVWPETANVAEARIDAANIPEEARSIWQEHDRATHDLSLSLCEQLRLILEPTQATKMRGDFRTGKRLNMRRIIPYIASDYKKDKIWMRRTKPSKRQYQVMIALDDSKSMSDSNSVKLAFDTLALTAKALSQLEVGQISIVRFGEDVKVVHAFEEPFNMDSGGKVVHHFKFDQPRTDVAALTKTSIHLFDVVRAQQNIRSISGSDLWQLQLIISDGICEDHEGIRRLVREALGSRIMMIFVILDAIHPERKDSILDIKSYSFEAGENGQVLRESRYLDSFPFNYFVIVRDIRELPSVLASALRQWFAEVAER